MILPAAAADGRSDFAALWNDVGIFEARKSSPLAREGEFSHSAGLATDRRPDLVLGLAREVFDRHKVAVDVAIYVPGVKGASQRRHAKPMRRVRQHSFEGLVAAARPVA